MVELTKEDYDYIANAFIYEMMIPHKYGELKNPGIRHYFNSNINTYDEYYTAVMYLIIKYHKYLDFDIIFSTILTNSNYHDFFFNEEEYSKYLTKILNYVDDKILYNFLSAMVLRNLHSYEDYLGIYKIYGRIFNKNNPVSKDEFNTINQNIKDYKIKYEDIRNVKRIKYHDDGFVPEFLPVDENHYIVYKHDKIPENYILQDDEYYDSNGNIYNKESKLDIYVDMQMDKLIDKHKKIIRMYIDIIMREKLLSVYN